MKKIVKEEVAPELVSKNDESILEFEEVLRIKLNNPA